MKVILILIDGMRPDSLYGVPEFEELKRCASVEMDAVTVFPPVTLPCHISLFHSVPPSRHGTTTNAYAPQVRPVPGLFEQLKAARKTTAMFYNFEELRDVAPPAVIHHSSCYHCKLMGYELSTELVAEESVSYIKRFSPDFSFIYLALPDGMGHKYGWMSGEYLDSVRKSWRHVKHIMDSLGEEYTYIITADHGGHDRIHGTDMKEDMTIPIIIKGEGFGPDKPLNGASILDIAPTVADMLGAFPDDEWEGRVL